MEEALLADRAIVMNKGEIVLEGTPEAIFENGELLEIPIFSGPKAISSSTIDATVWLSGF